jgi:hypothetical protein
MTDKLKVKDISKNFDQMVHINLEELPPLPPPYDKVEELPGFKKLTEQTKENYDGSLDGVVAAGLPKPKSKEEEQELIDKFISGIKKLFSKNNNWGFWQPLILSMETLCPLPDLQ